MRRWVWMQTMLPMLIRKTDPDLVHFTNASAPLLMTKPGILTIHDASLFFLHNYHPWSRLFAIRLLLPIQARRSAAVITVSNQARQDLLLALRIPPEKVHVVYEAAPAHFKPVHNVKVLERIRRRYNLPPRFVLHVGTLEPRKNLGRLLLAHRLLLQRGENIPLILAGPPGWKMNGFHRLLRDLAAQGVARWLGYVPDGDLPGLYSLATCLAFPSLYEGFGLPPVEAMACGLPVLTSQNTAMAEVCDSAAHLVDPYDVQAMAEAIHFLWHHDVERESLRHRGLQRASEFSWARAARETTDIYQRVLAG